MPELQLEILEHLKAVQKLTNKWYKEHGLENINRNGHECYVPIILFKDSICVYSDPSIKDDDIREELNIYVRTDNENNI